MHTTGMLHVVIVDDQTRLFLRVSCTTCNCSSEVIYLLSHACVKCLRSKDGAISQLTFNHQLFEYVGVTNTHSVCRSEDIRE